MPRPVEKDRQQAVRAAQSLFWRQGYTATSMNQLLGVMNMGAGSFYGAFDSKSRLFERIIDSYSARSMARFDAIRKKCSGLAVLAAFLDETLVSVSDRERRKGCLLVNSALELDEVEPALHQRVVAALALLEGQIEECVREDRSAGVLRTDLTEADIVGLILTQVQGLRVESRLGLSRETARQRIDTMFISIARPNGEVPEHAS